MLGDGKYKLEIGVWQARFLPSVNLRGRFSAIAI
jgi:hypothetical protein